MHRQFLHDLSVESRSPVGTRTRRSWIGVSRHRVSQAGSTVAEAPPQDADLVVLQLRDHPAHDFWAGGRHIAMPQTHEGALGVLDLRTESTAIFEAELDSLHLHLPRAALDDLACESGAPPVSRLVVDGGWTSDDQVFRRLAPLLAAATDAPGNATQAFMDHIILATAMHVAQTYGGMRRDVVRPGALAPWQLKRAQELLAADLGGRTSLHDVAEACGLSTSYFSRAFKVSTGWTPHSWLQARRLDRARALLNDTRVPLVEVALQSGFSDQSHFSRVLKSTTGQTPGAYRRAVHGARTLLSGDAG